VMPAKRGTALNTALRYFTNTTRQKSIAFVLSDFIDTAYEDQLRIAAKKHDIIGLKLYDKREQLLPDVGLLHIEDAETGAQQWVDTSSAFVRSQYEKEFFRITDYSNANFKKCGADLLHLRTDEDYVKVLQRFFISRS
ncbi:MAG TPA: hypothetical protein VM010_03195, partial [Chitinophagaceae bacterium]|nr:hypothetical protein [Chitinophagaceae bacterium]